jgi:rare lipoprotein A
VKVNDRGPFVDNRLIDLSYAAALQLDIVRSGTARVEVRALGSAPVEPAVTTTASTQPPLAQPPLAPPVLTAPIAVPAGDSPAAQPLFVQVGAFGDRANAARLVERLQVNGFVNAFVVTDGDGRRLLHRVRLGPLRDAHEFDQMSARLRSLGFGESQLVTAR